MEAISDIPKKNNRTFAVFFIILGIICAFILWSKQKNVILDKLPNLPNLSTGVTLTPTNNQDVILTNNNNNATINLASGKTISLELRLNRNAQNKIVIDNNQVLAITEVLKYDSTSGVFKGTVKTVGIGKGVITIMEGLRTQILKINIVVK